MENSTDLVAPLREALVLLGVFDKKGSIATTEDGIVKIDLNKIHDAMARLKLVSRLLIEHAKMKQAFSVMIDICK